jgi:hypothetical protein
MQIHGSQSKSVVLGHRVPTQDFFYNLVVHYHIPGQVSFMTFVNHLRCLFNVQCELCLVTCHDSGCCPKLGSIGQSKQHLLIIGCCLDLQTVFKLILTQVDCLVLYIGPGISQSRLDEFASATGPKFRRLLLPQCHESYFKSFQNDCFLMA